MWMWMWMWKGRKEGRKAGAYIPPFIRALQTFFINKRYGHKVVLPVSRLPSSYAHLQVVPALLGPLCLIWEGALTHPTY